MGTNERRYTRIASDEPGLLEFVPDRIEGQRRERCMVPVTIRSMACEGLGLQASAPVAPLHVESRIDVRMMIDGEEIGLPARVAWINGGNGGPTKLGAALLLALAPMDARRTWASWIVATTNQHAVAVPGPEYGSHRIHYRRRGPADIDHTK